MRKGACFVSLIVLLLLPHRASALFQFRDGWTKLLVTPQPSSSRSAISQIITDAGGTILWDYGAFILVNVPVPQEATVTSRLAPLDVSVRSGLEERIFLPGATFDPRVGIPQNIDPSQMTFSYPPGHQGLYVVQLIGPTVNTWWNEIQALGATIAVYLHENTYVVAATPEQAQLFADLPYVQFVDFLHPFEKGEDFSKLPTSVRYDVYVGGVATATDSSDADVAKIAEAINSRYGSTEIAYNIRVKGEDAARLARVPLVYTFSAQAISLPHVWAAMPRRAPAGSTITISGEGFIKGASVTFGGVPSPQVEVLGDDRLRVQVPETTATGPVDLLVSVPTDQKQFFSGGSASGFNIDAPSRSTFKAGDLIAGNTLFNRYIEGTDGGELQWLDPTDVSLFVRRQSTLLDANTLFIDPKGNVIFVDRNAATQYDLMSEKSNAAPPFAAGASAVLFDRAGNAVVVRGNTIERRAANGSPTGSASLVSASRITGADLAADQCTLVYTMAKTVGAYDVCAFQPLPPIFSSTKDQLSVRILPDGTLLAVDDTDTRVINTSGTVLATIAGGGSALALSPDGSLAWISGYDGIRSYDLRTKVASIPVRLLPENTSVVALAVYGGWSAARGAATYSVPSPRHRAAGH